MERSITREDQEARQVQVVPVRFGAIPAGRIDVLHRALTRARRMGASAELVSEESSDQVLKTADVIVSLIWPCIGEPQTDAMAAMAASKPAIVLETVATADWPALDPQTWQPRGFGSEPPIVVSIDPRDEEHSLMLAIQRLSSDAALRAQLARAAHAWWQRHPRLA